jgi:hypothetical protein
MKQVIVSILAGIGILALALLTLRFFVGDLSYEKTVREEFGTPSAIHSLTELYERVAKGEQTLEPVGAKLRRIPPSWIPNNFSPIWRDDRDTAIAQVDAHFNEQGVLVAIEFDGSRYGCYISRDASRYPASFASLQRLAISPLYVTGRIGFNEEI